MHKKIIAYIIFLSLFSCIFIVHFCTASNSKDVEVEITKIFSKLKGTWVKPEFLNDIRDTKSYMSAVNKWVGAKKAVDSRDGNFTGLYFSFDKYLGYLCTFDSPLYGWNSGIQKVHSLSSNKYELFFNTDYNSNRGKCILIVTPTKITCTYMGKTITFIKLKEKFGTYINRVTLTGKYVDKSGSEYVFYNNQTAKWPDKTFKYHIGADAIWAIDDYISLDDDKGKSTDVIYCYEWKDNKLYIYKGISKSQEGIFKEDLYVVLSKM